MTLRRETVSHPPRGRGQAHLRRAALLPAVSGTLLALALIGCQRTPEPTNPDMPLAAAAQTGTSVRIATIGDFGWDGTALGDVSALIHSWNPDHVLALGDNNYDNGSASTIDPNIGKYFHDFIYPYTGAFGAGATTNRFWAALGNHDWIAAGAAPYLAYFTFPNNERYYDFVQGPVHFFAIDSDPSEPDGTSGSSTQANWLMSRLAASTSPWNLVFFHHPPFSSGQHGNNAYMNWPFQAWGAHAVITGHDHTYERFDIGGFPYFVNGLGGRSLYSWGTIKSGSVARYNSDYGAQLIDATDQSITFKFYNRAGALIDSYTQTKSGGGATTVSFQNGAFPTAAYAGNIDAHLSQANATVNYGTAATLLIDGDDPNGSGNDKRTLLKWDVSAVPAGKTVTAASLTFNVTDVSTQNYQVYQLKRNWTESGASWNSYASGSAWQTAGADGADDRATVSLGTVSGNTAGTLTVALNASGIALVQGWVNGSIANQGIAILNAANTNGLDVSSSEAATVAARPKLTVTYQ
ncbi:MAG TPA: DNRLRE domain-containing protein [Fibrobacteria bacterium]|nr:DNRLRE domain-containing protein [Fibrobacteria bacterium]